MTLPTMMTRDEFIHGYCERSKITRQFFDSCRQAVECDCGDELCDGWQAVPRRECVVNSSFTNCDSTGL